MNEMKSCSLEHEALEPTEIMNKESLVHSAENVMEQEYNSWK